MKHLFSLLILLSIFQLTITQDSPSFWEQWQALTEEEKCRFCAQTVYLLTLPDELALAKGQFEIAFEHSFCPRMGVVLFNNITAISESTCSSITATWNFFYPLFYYPAFPFRDFYCYPLCGDSGKQWIDQR